jgi:hypothetical protein
MNLEKVKKFYDYFSLVAVNDDKRPNHKWKVCQTEKMSWNDLESELFKVSNFGIVTGFEDLECIDIDLKVFSTAKEQKEFFEEYLGYLKDNILDFDKKIVIYKTKNAGYHLLYKSKRVQGNLKLAKLKGHTEAVIETRGVGGYIFAYPENKVSDLSYFNIQYISDDDRELIMSFSKMYNYIEAIPETPKKEKNVTFGDVKPWDDYNDKTNIFDIINDDFTIVGNHNKRYVIKRHNSNSPHSGYVFKDTGFMYLFSTGTIYPHEKLITPFLAYSYKYHNGNLSEATKEIYKNGFGSRVVIKENEPEEKIILNKDNLVFPLEIYPKAVQNYIIECSQTLDSSIDYMGCSLLWLISLSIGNSMVVEVKRGWIENGVVWVAIVGKAGIGKTPSISNVIFPLEKINNREISNYIKEYEKYEYYNSLSKKEQDEFPEVHKPKKSQFMANDITVEALVDLHQQSDNSVGVFKDELAGWFKDMNKYKPGSDLEFWLSTWSGKSVNLNRLTRAGSFVAKPFIPVLGGIQPSIFNSFYTEENKDNGFIDRMLLSYPELQVEKYNESEMNYETIQWYSDTIVAFFERIKTNLVKRDENQKIEPITLKFSEEAKKEWVRIYNDITIIQNDDSENEYMKSMLPKQKSYIPRFALLIHVFNAIGEINYNVQEISKDSILKAEKLSKYFIAMAKKIKIDSVEVQEIKQILKDQKGKTTKEKFEQLYSANKNLNKKEVSEQLGVSLQMIYKYIKQIENGTEV